MSTRAGEIGMITLFFVGRTVPAIACEEVAIHDRETVERGN